MKMEVTPGARPDSAVVYALLSGNESALWAMDGYDAAATVLLNRPLPPSTANVTTTSFAIRNSVLYVLTSDGIVTREPLTAAGLPSSVDSDHCPRGRQNGRKPLQHSSSLPQQHVFLPRYRLDRSALST